MSEVHQHRLHKHAGRWMLLTVEMAHSEDTSLDHGIHIGTVEPV